MKYNQPFDQPDDPNAPYIDGEPAAGIQGSIVPAHSIEYDQREIVEVISFANIRGYRDDTGTPCAPPTNSDLTQLRKAIWGIAFHGVLTMNVNLYVNPTTGDDSAYDGSSATVSGSRGPFKTLQKALDTVGNFIPSQFGATINLSAGTHDVTAGNYALTKNWAHCNVTIIGAGPSSTLLTGSGAGGGVLVVQGPNFYYVSNLAVSYTGGASNAGSIGAAFGASVTVNNVTFNGASGTGSRFLVASGSGTINVGAVNLSGNAPGSFFSSSANSTINFGGAVVSTTTAVTCGSFLALSGVALVTTLPNPPTFPGAASVTGSKYQVDGNSVIYSGGVTWPGSTAGATSTGGQVIP